MAPKKIALLLIDHGSKLKEANDMLVHVANLTKKMQPSLIVQWAHMELANPTMGEGIKACIEKGAQTIIAQPYMLSPGRHATQDIPNSLKTIMQTYPKIRLEIQPCLGVHPKLISIILERILFYL